MPKLILVLLLLVGLSNLSFAQNSVKDKARLVPANRAAIEADIFSLINIERRNRGRTNLRWSAKLYETAAKHSKEMVFNKIFSHRSFDGRKLRDRLNDVGYPKTNGAAENIFLIRNRRDVAATAVSMWLRSAGHRGNILDRRFSESAVGIAFGPDGSIYITQVFGGSY